MKLFWRLFLSFWAASILMSVLTLALNEFLPIKALEEHRKPFVPELTEAVLQKSVNAYERDGATGFFSQLHQAPLLYFGPAFLFDQNAQLLEKTGDLHRSYAQRARQAIDTRRAELLRLDLRTLFVCPVQSATGRHYAVVLTVFEPALRLLRPRFWFNLMVGLIPGALICIALSLYITRPISRLQSTAQRIADGDFGARALLNGAACGDELGKLARDFDAMASRIQALMSAQRRFVADVSHELGGPLTRMHLALVLLRRKLAGSNPELTRIERETRKLSDLVQQLLLLAGLEAGKVPAEALAPVSMRSLFQSVIEDASFEAAQRGCTIAASREEITALVYPQLLRRAIDNVLRNAIRHSPRGSEIIVTCRVAEDQRHILLEILDSGPGVPPAMLSDIFRPFFRTASARESRSAGTGLGLAIANEAVHRHNGTIVARNRDEGGLQVSMTLPLQVPGCVTR